MSAQRTAQRIGGLVATCVTLVTGCAQEAPAPQTTFEPVRVSVAASARSCDDALFVDDPTLDWFELSVEATCPARRAGAYCGADGIKAAFEEARDHHADRPVRIWLDTPGPERVFTARDGFDPYGESPRRLNLPLIGAFRTARTPISLRARDPRPGRTVVNHTFYFVGGAYLSVEGVTVGAGRDATGREYTRDRPLALDSGVHASGVATDHAACGLSGQCGDDPQGGPRAGVYGAFTPAHHIIVRGMTVQHLRDVTNRPTTPAAATFEDYEREDIGAVDGMKFQQAEDVWVIDNAIDDTSRHGIDNVGLHRGVFCGNVITHGSVEGYSIEAKGASTGVVYEGNVLYRSHGFGLGGQGTDFASVFPPSPAYAWDFEAEGTVARNNVIVDPRRTALEFAGCRDCKAVDNTVVFTEEDRARDGASWQHANAVRFLTSHLQSTADGAGDACLYLYGAGPEIDFDLDGTCWQTGSNLPAFEDATGSSTRYALTTGAVVENNVFASMTANTWTPDYCPFDYDHYGPLPPPSPTVGLIDHNYWYNAGLTGAASIPAGCFTGLAGMTMRRDDPGFVGTRGFAALDADALFRAVSVRLRPLPRSPLRSSGVTRPPGAVAYDLLGQLRTAPWSIGAIER